MTDTDHLLSREQVAARLAVSIRSVRRYTESGRLPSVHIGRNVRYRRDDVERLIAEDAATGGQERPHDGHAGPCPVEPAPAMTVHGHGGPGTVNTGHEAPPMASQGPGVASPLAEVSLQAVEALREQLAAVRAENAALREDVARQAADVARKAEAAGMWQGRARTLEEQLRQLTAGRAEATAPPNVLTHGQDMAEASRPPVAPSGEHRGGQGLWQRLLRRLAGA